MTAVAAASSSQVLWFVSRGSGLVLFVTLSVVLALGVGTRLGSAPRGQPRFVTAELHRTVSLFAVALLALHITTALLDPYVSIGWLATAVPFVSHYRAAVVGLGALAVDIMGAAVATSLLRRRLGYRTWRAVHWLAYLSWPTALVHALAAGPDAHLWWAAGLEWGSVGLVVTAVVARVVGTLRERRARALSRRRPPRSPGSPAGVRHLERREVA